MLCYSSIISEADLASIISLITAQNEQDGTASARGYAQKLKHNRQEFSSPALDYAQKILLEKFQNTSIIQNYTLMDHLISLRIVRYGIGMYYGKHVDLTHEKNMRRDLSFTIFLSDQDTYEGGFLRLHHYAHHQDIKLPAGSIVIYPSDMLHEVTPVTKGERLVMVGWLQSKVADKEMRHILYDMTHLTQNLNGNTKDDLEISGLAHFIYQRLLRRFSTIS